MKVEKVIEAINEKLASQECVISWQNKRIKELEADLKKANEEIATLRCGYEVDRSAYEVDEEFNNG